MAPFAKAQWQDVVSEYVALEVHEKNSQDAKYPPAPGSVLTLLAAWHTFGAIKRAGLPIPFSERGC